MVGWKDQIRSQVRSAEIDDVAMERAANIPGPSDFTQRGGYTVAPPRRLGVSPERVNAPTLGQEMIGDM